MSELKFSIWFGRDRPSHEKTGYIAMFTGKPHTVLDSNGNMSVGRDHYRHRRELIGLDKDVIKQCDLSAEDKERIIKLKPAEAVEIPMTKEQISNTLFNGYMEYMMYLPC
jgi:hypothetical protein